MLTIKARIHSRAGKQIHGDVFIFINRKPIQKIGSVHKFSDAKYNLFWNVPKLAYWLSKGAKFSSDFMPANTSSLFENFKFVK